MTRRAAVAAGALLLLLSAAGCTRSNRARLERLEREAGRRPRPELDRHLDERGWAVPVRGAARAVTLPLERGRTPVVRGRVDGVAMPMLLDTGASVVALSGHAAEEVALYVPRARSLGALSPGYDARYRVGVFRELALGALRFGPGAAVVPEREDARQAPGGLDTSRYAILGTPVLGCGTVVFDFARRTVTLRPGAGGRAGRALFTDVVVEGRRLWMLVDSGASRVWLEPWAARALGRIDDARAAALARKGDAFGRGPHDTFVLERVEVAGRAFPSVPGGAVHTFPDDVALGPDGARPAGLLGLAAFGERVWTVDFDRGRVAVADPGASG